MFFLLFDKVPVVHFSVFNLDRRELEMKTLFLREKFTKYQALDYKSWTKNRTFLNSKLKMTVKIHDFSYR